MAEISTEKDIPSKLLFLALAACALILFGAIGEIVITVCKWVGWAMMGFVVVAAVSRLLSEAWPEWVITALRKVSGIVERVRA